MIALAAPLIFVIVRRAVHTRRCRPLVGPVLIAMLVLAVGPLWNRQTLGAWLSDPYPYYSKVYFPFDKPGFGVDTTPPLRQVPRELAGMDAWSSDVTSIVRAFGRAVRFTQRILAVSITFGDGWRIALVLLLFASCVRSTSAIRFAIVECACLFAAYLVFHGRRMVVSYAELLPILHFMAAVALVRLLAPATALSKSHFDYHESWVGFNHRGDRAPSALSWRPGVSWYGSIAGMPFIDRLISSSEALHRSRCFLSDTHRHKARTSRSRATSQTWRTRDRGVHDRGAENQRLEAVAPDRQPYLLDMGTLRLEPLGTDSKRPGQ